MKVSTLYGQLPNGNVINSLKSKYLIDTICLLFIVILIYSSFRKVLSFKSYTDEAIFYLQNMRIIKLEIFVWIVRGGVGFLCFTELVSATLLPIPKYRLFGLYLAFCVMIIILFYLIIILLINSSISTYFGSIFPYVTYLGHLIITMCMMFLSVTGILIKNR